MRLALPRAALMAAILLLAFLLRLVELAKADLGMDGGLAVAMANQGPQTVFAVSASDVHPPLFYLLLHYWTLLCGLTPLATKYLSVVFGVLTVALVFTLGRQLRHARLGLLAAALMAISPVNVVNAAVVRDFVMAGFFATLATFFFIKVVASEDRDGGAARKPTVAFLLASVAGLLTSYLTIGVLAAQVMYLLSRRASRLHWKRWLGMLTGIVVACAPWIWVALSSTVEEKMKLLIAPTQAGAGANAAEGGPFLASALRHLTSSEFFALEWLPVATPFVVVLMYGLVKAWSTNWKRRGLDGASADGHDGLLLLATATSLGITYGIVRFWLHDTLPSRYVVIMSPFFLLMVARGLDALADTARLIPAVATATLLAGSAMSVRDFYDRPLLPLSLWDPNGMVRYVDTRAKDGDGVIFTNLEQAGYYLSLSKRHLEWHCVMSGPSYLEGDLAARVQRVLPGAAAKHEALWLVLYLNGYASNAGQIRDWLDRNTFLSSDEWVSDGVMRRYAAGGARSRQESVGANFGDLALLEEAELSETAASPGDIRLALRWQASGKIGADYTLFVHLMDDAGKRWAQFDAPPSPPTSQWQMHETYGERRAIQVPADLPAGTYWLDVGLYRGEERIALVSGGNTVRLGPITVR